MLYSQSHQWGRSHLCTPFQNWRVSGFHFCICIKGPNMGAPLCGLESGHCWTTVFICRRERYADQGEVVPIWRTRRSKCIPNFFLRMSIWRPKTQVIRMYRSKKLPPGHVSSLGDHCPCCRLIYNDIALFDSCFSRNKIRILPTLSAYCFFFPISSLSSRGLISS